MVAHGKQIGNFFRVKDNGVDLFDTLVETPEALLKRRGLVTAPEMEKKWPMVNFIHHGGKVTGEYKADARNEPKERNRKKKTSDKPQTADAFTCVMVAVVSALDDCLPSSHIQDLLIQVFVALLEGDEDTKEALRVHLRVNIESWRSLSCTRNLSFFTKQEMRKSLGKHWQSSSGEIAIRQMNNAETKDMVSILIWLLGGDDQSFTAMSVITFAVAEALRQAKFDLCTDGDPQHEGQACITYQTDSRVFGEGHPQGSQTSRGLNFRALQTAWPYNNPQTMIDTLPAKRQIIKMD